MKKIHIFSAVSLCGALVTGAPVLAADSSSAHAQGSQHQQSSQAAASSSQQRSGAQSSLHAGQRGAQSAVNSELRMEDAATRDSATIVLNEERLNVGKREVPAGGILLRKKIVTDDANETVELRREDIEIVHLTPEEARERQAQASQSSFDEPFSEGEIFIPLMREEASAQKEVATREVLRAQPTVETEQREIQATLRREEVDVERVESDRQNAVAQQGAARMERSMMPQNDDPEALEQQIRQRLQASVGLNQEDLQNIDIEVEDEVVRLSGSISDEQARERILAAVDSMPQVGEVEDELR